MTSVVKEWMSGTPVTIEPDASAFEALGLMVEHGIRHLPVLDPQGRVVGVISIDDLRAALPLGATPRASLDWEARQAMQDYRVGELMTFAPHTVRAETPLEEAADLLATFRLGCLPVVESQGGLVGILSETDALRALSAALWTDRVRSEHAFETDLDALVGGLQSERDRIFRALEGVSPVEDPTSLRALAARRLEGLDRALDRASGGAFGVCQRCQRRIPPARLRALPGIVHCSSCARELGS